MTNAARIVRAALTALTLMTLAFIALAGTASASPLTDGMSAFRRGDYVKAARLLGPLAEHGDAEAQSILGFMYEYGRGVPQNQVIAVHWYKCAAEQGNARGQYHLGLMFNKGHGVPLSAVTAYKWLNLAAANAHPSERDYYLRMRDAVAWKLNNAQRADAEGLSVGLVPVRP